jgi:hypothetical protein
LLVACIRLFPRETRIIAAFLVVIGCCASSRAALAPAGTSLAGIFVSALAEVKAGTRVPVLLPTELPRPLSDAKHVVLEKITANEYAVAFYLRVGRGSCWLFAAKKNAGTA